ncbi:hypothetical protein TNCV_702121 [Trichonephila clavipes]|nr:hypothetical protein TNCV_702121 [Trichonephila clavipes]
MLLDFILMDGTSPSSDCNLEDHGLERMEWPALSRPESDRTFKLFGREVAAKSSLIYETRLTLCLVFASYSGVRQLNKQHGKSMPPMHSS